MATYLLANVKHHRTVFVVCSSRSHEVASILFAIRAMLQIRQFRAVLGMIAQSMVRIPFCNNSDQWSDDCLSDILALTVKDGVEIFNCLTSALVEWPQVISVFLGITLRYRFDEAAVYLPIAR